MQLHELRGVETIKRRTRAAHGCLVAGQSLWARACTTRPMGCTPALFVTKKSQYAVLYEQWRIQKFWKGAEDNLSAPSSHNEIYAFYTEKAAFCKKKVWANGGTPPPSAPPL